MLGTDGYNMKNRLSTLSFLFLILSGIQGIAQPYFQRFDSVDVKIGSSYITNPWAGGLNFVQTSKVDLNNDGTKDLVVFDRTGDKLRTFVNRGTPGMVDYKYDASYEMHFPELHSWVLMEDYNMDGKEDIFTYSKASGGIDIYKNISSMGGGLQFQLVSLQQKSIYNPTRANTTAAAIPDGGVSNSWDGVSGGAAFISRPISVTNINTSYWKITDVTVTILHPNVSDLIVYLVNPCGDKIRLIRNAGGSGDNFTATNFNPYASNVIGSTGYNTAPFTGTFAPEAGAGAWSGFLASSCNPNGVWKINVGDQTGGNTGVVQECSITFYSPNYTPFTSLSPVNLYVSSVDIPALSDIDNDGDLDIVTFASTGTYMEYHENLSMDLYGHADSLCYFVRNRCWGYASEDAMSNDYTLHDVCGVNVGNPGIIPDSTTTAQEEQAREERHSGSCQLCIDLDGDGDKEFIVGDVSFANLTMLTNGGTPKAANMVAVDVAFPSNNTSTVAVDMTLFPCAYYVDVNNDSLKDLIVSPNAPNASENFNSEHYYKNTGTNESPVFQFQQGNLLQDNMIEVGEGAYPVLFDYDNDGLLDLFVGNYGYYNVAGFEHKLAQFKNIGTPSTPKFELITRDYNNYSTIGITNIAPAFGDLDGDGDKDMIIGAYDGRLHYFQNIAPAGATANFVLTAANLKNSNNRVIDVGDFAAPQIYDIDGDGMNDVVIGSKNGKLAYFHHTGSPTSTVPALDSMTYFFGHVKVNQPGYSTGWCHPYIFKQSGQTTIIAGTQLGYLRVYNHIDGNLTGTFALVDSTLMGAREGDRTTPTGADLNNDGFIDLIVGNYSGGLSFFKGTATVSTSDDLGELPSWNMDAYPNPANATVTIRINTDKNSAYKIELYNVMGQLIFSEKTTNRNITLATEQLKQGMYVCKVSELDAAGNVKSGLVKRIIIQH